MLSKILLEDNLSILKYSTAIILAYNTFKFISKEKYFLRKSEDERKFLVKIKEQLKKNMIPEFLFLFLSLASVNLIMRIGMSYNKRFKKLGFFVGFLTSYYFV